MKAEDFIDYNDKSLFEDHDHIPSSDEKEFYTPEEAYELVMSDKALKGRHDVKQGCNPCATRTILLALLITLFAPAAAWAQQQVTTINYNNEGVFYTLWSDGTASIEYNASHQTLNGELVLHETLTYEQSLYTLVSIANNAFINAQLAGELAVPNSVTAIGNQAFYQTKFSSVVVGDGVVSIGKEAFKCPADDVVLGRSLQSIGNWAFWYSGGDSEYHEINVECRSATPPSLGEDVFHNQLRYYVTVPCGTMAAYGATEWAQTYYISILQPSVYNISEAASQRMEIDGLYYELFCDGHTATLVQDDSYATMDWASIEDFELEEIQYTVTAIADGAFDGCPDLEGVSCHALQLATIGANAFRNCTSLTSLGFYNCATPPTVGEGAFENVPLADMLLGVPYCSQYAYSQHEVFGQCKDIQGYGNCEYNFTNQFGEGDGLWSNPDNWMDADMEPCIEAPGEGAQVAIFTDCKVDVDATVGSITTGNLGEVAPLTVKSGATLTATEFVYTSNNPANLVIEDGAQVIHPNAGAKATVQKTVTAYTPNAKDGWHLIGHSFADNGAVDEIDNLLTNDYDLYYYDEPTHYWRNHKNTANNFTELKAAKGYLYANCVGQTIGLKGTLNPANAMVNIPLSYEADALKGFNLVGNPFAHNVTAFTGNNVATEVYRMNEAKNNLMVSTISATNPLKPSEGIFVKATGDEASITFNNQTRGMAEDLEPVERLTIQIDLLQDGLIIDRFILKDSGEPLEKFTLNENSTRIYATMDGKDYAVATVGGRDAARHVSTEMSLNFKAAQNGEYTLSFNLENVDLDYLHLIDNKTGNDIDLLTPAGFPLYKGGQGGFNQPLQPSYTFTAKTTDHASRFRLAFSASADETSVNQPFAYIANGEIVINEADARGASLQVVDMVGRVIVCRDTSNVSAISTNGMAPGIYVLRLIDGDSVRTQKIVID